MAKYVDGFVIPVPKKSLKAYQTISKRAGKVWMDCGALEYIECVGDDMKFPYGISFPKLAKVKAGETVIFSWIAYKSKAHRDKVNAKVMKDKRMLNMMDESVKIFETKRMCYGGFKTIVDL